MLMTQSNSADIQKYYEGSYVKLQELGDKVLYINKVNREGVYFTDCMGSEGVIWLHDESPYNLEMVLPNKVMYQMGQLCYSIARVPARQYHRGITSSNCQIKRLRDEGWAPVSLSFDMLQGYVSKPFYRPLSEIIMTIQGGSEAVSDRFAYQAKGGKLWCDLKPIATINAKLKTIACTALLVPEINKFLARTASENFFKVVPL